MSALPAVEPPDYGLIDRAGGGSFIFYPRRDLTVAPLGATDEAIEVAPGVSLGARLYVADPAFPTLLYFHGNGEVVPDHDGIAPLYHRAGANLFVVDFRGYGRSGGAPSFATLVADALPVAEHFHAMLDARGLGARRFIMGRSLGSQPALEIAAHAPGRFAGLIIESGAATLGRLLGYLGLDPRAPEARAFTAAHEAKFRSIALPALILHGELDELIPLSAAAELYELLSHSQRELLVVPNAGHNDILWVGEDEYFAAISRFTAVGVT